MKKWTAVILVIVMALSSLMGCSGGTNDSSSKSDTGSKTEQSKGGETSTPGAEADTPFLITTLASFYQQEPPNTKNNPVFDFIQEKLNVEIQITWSPNGETATKFNTMMAGGNALMVMGGADVTSSNYIRMCKTGAFCNIPERAGLAHPYVQDRRVLGYYRYY